MQAPGTFKKWIIRSEISRPVTPAIGSECRHIMCHGSNAIAAGPKITHIPSPRLFANGEPAGRERIQQTPSRPSTSGRKNAAIPIVCSIASERYAPIIPVQLCAGRPVA